MKFKVEAAGFAEKLRIDNFAKSQLSTINPNRM
jgi:hypothetical protein